MPRSVLNGCELVLQVECENFLHPSYKSDGKNRKSRQENRRALQEAKICFPAIMALDQTTMTLSYLCTFGDFRCFTEVITFWTFSCATRKEFCWQIFNCVLLQGFWMNTTKQDVNGEDVQVLKTCLDYWIVIFLYWFLALLTGRLQ
jgi:hypothetical protein